MRKLIKTVSRYRNQSKIMGDGQHWYGMKKGGPGYRGFAETVKTHIGAVVEFVSFGGADYPLLADIRLQTSRVTIREMATQIHDSGSILPRANPLSGRISADRMAFSAKVGGNMIQFIWYPRFKWRGRNFHGSILLRGKCEN